MVVGTGSREHPAYGPHDTPGGQEGAHSGVPEFADSVLKLLLPPYNPVLGLSLPLTSAWPAWIVKSERMPQVDPRAHPGISSAETVAPSAEGLDSFRKMSKSSVAVH